MSEPTKKLKIESRQYRLKVGDEQKILKIGRPQQIKLVRVVEQVTIGNSIDWNNVTNKPPALDWAISEW